MGILKSKTHNWLLIPLWAEKFGNARSRMFVPTHCFTTRRSASLKAFLRLHPTCRVHQSPKSSVATHLSQMKGINTAAECITAACCTSFGCSPHSLAPTRRLNTTFAVATHSVGYAISLQGACSSHKGLRNIGVSCSDLHSNFSRL